MKTADTILNQLTVAVAGATGAVGAEFLRLFEQRGLSFGELRLLASARSAGTSLTCNGHAYEVGELTHDALEGVDIALFSAGGARSREFAPHAAERGTVVIDNSSAFRMTPDVPLVVPEINGHLLNPIRQRLGAGGPGAIIANPNCSTIIMLVPLHPLYREFGIERIVVATYQAVSGAGAAAMRELREQTAAHLEGRPIQPRAFAHPCAFNVFSHDSAIDPATGRNVEEQKMIDETRKIWNDAKIGVAPTCVRVPVLRAHAESINVTLRRPATEEQVRAALGSGDGIHVLDDRASNHFPMPVEASDRDEVLVGRIRPDQTQPTERVAGEPAHLGWELFVCGDQIRKGAALNAVQIAELLTNR